jgi:hypothetical protein
MVQEALLLDVDGPIVFELRELIQSRSAVLSTIGLETALVRVDRPRWVVGPGGGDEAEPDVWCGSWRDAADTRDRLMETTREASPMFHGVFAFTARMVKETRSEFCALSQATLYGERTVVRVKAHDFDIPGNRRVNELRESTAGCVNCGRAHEFYVRRESDALPRILPVETLGVWNEELWLPRTTTLFEGVGGHSGPVLYRLASFVRSELGIRHFTAFVDSPTDGWVQYDDAVVRRRRRITIDESGGFIKDRFRTAFYARVGVSEEPET